MKSVPANDARSVKMSISKKFANGPTFWRNIPKINVKRKRVNHPIVYRKDRRSFLCSLSTVIRNKNDMVMTEIVCSCVDPMRHTMAGTMLQRQEFDL
jgi:hypothetical protein